MREAVGFRVEDRRILLEITVVDRCERPTLTVTLYFGDNFPSDAKSSLKSEGWFRNYLPVLILFGKWNCAPARPSMHLRVS